MTAAASPVEDHRRQPSAHTWLQAQAQLDWQTVGLPAFKDWDKAITAIAVLVAHSSSPMALMLGSNGILLANHAAQRLLAETAGPINSRSIFTVFPDKIDFFSSVLRRGLIGKPSKLRGQWIQLKQNQHSRLHCFNMDFTPITDTHGAIAGVLSLGSDVTYLARRTQAIAEVKQEFSNQRELASALNESRLQFQSLTEAIPQIVWSSDLDGRHDYFSKRWSEFTGVAPDDLNEETWKALIHPEHRDFVINAWKTALRTGDAYDIDYRFRHHTGEYRWLRVMALPVRDAAGEITRWFGTSTDVHDTYLVSEERERLAQELERIATEDQLTGALTRRAFMDRATLQIKSSAMDSAFGLLMMDIDHFKSINDTYGHPVGDQVLATATNRIKEATRPQDLIGRLGGEEFGILLPECNHHKTLTIAERIRVSIAETPFPLADGTEVPITISIGATVAQGAKTPLEQLLLLADKALYCSKSGGRNRVTLSDPDE